ncbi:hypothetical protein BA195_13960 [Tenacibaculum soleae]|uniref:Uncharacterized protein n=2 Tax=Tenacibaculum soleae TaxID=447689 RepID=A0A1B9XYV5_9FLAO|nr:hypothetical protein BA195_13960 [Tenacibaculum soleae]
MISLISCNGIKENWNISGNWYSSSSEKLENNTIDYTEIFIKNDTVHICSEYMLRMFPRKIILKNDSLFFHSKVDSNFVGNILKKTKKGFDLGIKNENKRTYNQMENFNNLESLVNGEITEKVYYSEFVERMNNRYEELGIEN